MAGVTAGRSGAVSRRRVLALAPGMLAVWASRALAQRPGGPARIGWLSYIAPPDVGVANLREGLGELGPRRRGLHPAPPPGPRAEGRAHRSSGLARPLGRLHGAGPVPRAGGVRLQW